jgi:amino acid transporter
MPMPSQYSSLHGYGHGGTQYTRDSLELASLASSAGDHEGEGFALHGGGDSDDASSRPSISSSRKLSLEQDDPLDSANLAAAGPSSSSLRPGRGYHPRSFSVGSTFDFAPNMFPLSSTAGAGGYAPLGATAGGAHGGPGGGSLEKHKTLTYLNGLSLVVGLIIGSGIFSSPSRVSTEVGSPGASLVIWVIAGVLAWTGAASYAELGGAIPLNGGSQVYLAKIIGELAGFLYTWVSVLVTKPGSAAIVAIIMGEYLVRAALGAEAEKESPWVYKSVAMLGLTVVTLCNCVSTKLSVRINDTLMFLKFFALVGVTVIGIVVAATGLSFDGPASMDWKAHEWFEGTSMDGSAWAVALYAGLFAYDGWDNTNFVAGEFHNPGRDLPRVIHTAMPLIIISYLLANMSYFFVLPIASINSSNAVAVLFGHKVFGPVGAIVFALVVSASCFGSLNSSTFSSSRLVYAAGKEGYIPEVFGQIGVGRHSHPDALSTTARSRSWLGRRLRSLVCDDDTVMFFTPVWSLILNAALTFIYIAVGEFSTLITFAGAAGYTFYFLTVLGLIILRIREPHLERPYKTWITTPIIFCCVSLFLLSRAVFANLFQTAIVVAFVLAGIPVYFFRIRGRDGPAVKREGPLEAAAMEGVIQRPWWKFWAPRT